MKKYLKISIKTIKKGFTLIELMIVIGIIGILAVVALPQYTSYIARAQTTEALNILGGAKAIVAEFLGTNGRYPTATEMLDIYPITANPPAQTKYIQNIVTMIGGTGDFIIYVDFKSTGTSSLIAGKRMSMKTYKVGDSRAGSSWVCQAETIPYDTVPAVCRNPNAQIS